MTTAAIIQARMGSVRLPGKVLMDVGGQPMLLSVIERVRQMRNIDVVMVATTTLPEDDAIVEACRPLHIVLFRGSARDVLDRYYRAAAAIGAHIVVRVTADCPLLDPEVSTTVLQRFRQAEGGLDYCSNIQDGTDGWDTEVFSITALLRAWKNAGVDEREHVTTHMRDPRHGYAIARVRTRMIPGKAKWSVDTLDDLERVRRALAEAKV